MKHIDRDWMNIWKHEGSGRLPGIKWGWQTKKQYTIWSSDNSEIFLKFDTRAAISRLAGTLPVQDSDWCCTNDWQLLRSESTSKPDWKGVETTEKVVGRMKWYIPLLVLQGSPSPRHLRHRRDVDCNTIHSCLPSGVPIAFTSDILSS